MLVAGRVSLLVSTAVFFVLYIWGLNMARAGHVPSLRRLPPLEALEEAVGRSVEMGRPVHFTIGRATLFTDQASITFAGLAMLSHLSELTARYGARLVATVAYAEVLPLIQATIQQSYVKEGRADAYQDAWSASFHRSNWLSRRQSSVRWSARK